MVRDLDALTAEDSGVSCGRVVAVDDMDGVMISGEVLELDMEADSELEGLEAILS